MIPLVCSARRTRWKGAAYRRNRPSISQRMEPTARCSWAKQQWCRESRVTGWAWMRKRYLRSFLRRYFCLEYSVRLLNCSLFSTNPLMISLGCSSRFIRAMSSACSRCASSISKISRLLFPTSSYSYSYGSPKSHPPATSSLLLTSSGVKKGCLASWCSGIDILRQLSFLHAGRSTQCRLSLIVSVPAGCRTTGCTYPEALLLPPLISISNTTPPKHPNTVPIQNTPHPLRSDIAAAPLTLTRCPQLHHYFLRLRLLRCWRGALYQSANHFPKQTIYPCSRFCRHLAVDHVFPACQLFCLFAEGTGVVEEVCLAAHETRAGVLSLVVAVELQPVGQVVETIAAGEVVHEYGSMCVTQVGRYQALILLLPRSVPQLQPVGGGVKGEVAREEIDAYGGLRGEACTLLAESNSSRMKRSMIDVFPTPMSPRNTSLNLVSHRLVLSSACPLFPCILLYRTKGNGEDRT